MDKIVSKLSKFVGMANGVRFPHFLIHSKISNALTSAFANFLILFALLTFARFLYQVDVNPVSIADNFEMVFIVGLVVIISGLFCIPFSDSWKNSSKTIKHGENQLSKSDIICIRRKNHTKSFFSYIIFNLYFVIGILCIFLAIFSISGFNFINFLSENIARTAHASLFIFSLIISCFVVYATLKHTQKLTGDHIWQRLRTKKWLWFSFYVLVISSSSTLAIIS